MCDLHMKDNVNGKLKECSLDSSVSSKIKRRIYRRQVDHTKAGFGPKFQEIKHRILKASFGYATSPISGSKVLFLCECWIISP